MSSIAIGRSMVIDAAVEAAVAAPLRESVKAAAERAAEQPQGRKHKEASVPLTIFGKDVTEVLADVKMAERAAEEKQASKRQRALSVARRRSMLADEKVRAACKKLLGCGGAGGAKHLSIQDLRALIIWRGGKLPASLKKENRDEILHAWERVKATREELQAKADAPGNVGQQQQDGRAGVADDASDDDDENDMEVDEDEDEEVTTAEADDNNSGEDMEDAEGEVDVEGEGEDDDEDEDEEFEIECILAQRGSGRHLKYLVKWKGYDDQTWESKVSLQNAAALDEWEEKQGSEK